MKRRDLIAEIRRAFNSKKFDSLIANQFEEELGKDPNLDLERRCVPMWTEGFREDINVEGIISITGRFYALRVSYSQIPKLAQHPDFGHFYKS